MGEGIRSKTECICSQEREGKEHTSPYCPYYIDKQFKKIIARFKPCRVDDLRKELIPMIGETAEFYYYWRMDDADPFPNEWALATKDDRFCGYWIPERDLEIIE